MFAIKSFVKQSHSLAKRANRQSQAQLILVLAAVIVAVAAAHILAVGTMADFDNTLVVVVLVVAAWHNLVAEAVLAELLAAAELG